MVNTMNFRIIFPANARRHLPLMQEEGMRKGELQADADRMMREYRAQAVDVLCPRELSAKMLKRNKINLNEISHQTATGLIDRVLKMGVLLTKPNGYVLF
ncbi:hypothetical protein K1719_023827 [Acacia pycnantha]|nr:hypothetical protein K1719_023827 [Acacia pycnantha]